MKNQTPSLPSVSAVFLIVFFAWSSVALMGASELVVSAGVNVDLRPVNVGGPLTVTLSIKNQGSASAPASTTRLTEPEDQFRARSFRGEGALNGQSSSGERPEANKDNIMITVAFVIAWLAVVGLVLIAQGDYRQR